MHSWLCTSHFAKLNFWTGCGYGWRQKRQRRLSRSGFSGEVILRSVCVSVCLSSDLAKPAHVVSYRIESVKCASQKSYFIILSLFNTQKLWLLYIVSLLSGTGSITDNRSPSSHPREPCFLRWGKKIKTTGHKASFEKATSFFLFCPAEALFAFYFPLCGSDRENDAKPGERGVWLFTLWRFFLTQSLFRAASG